MSGCGWSSCPPCSIEVLVNVVRVEHILAVKNDVFPFDGADMLQATDVGIFAFRNAYFQNAGDFLGLPIDATGQQSRQAATGLHLLMHFAGADPSSPPGVDMP